MRKISLILAVLCLGITMTASSAMAFSLAGGYTGPVKFEFGSFDSGTTGYPVSGVGGAPTVEADWPGVGPGGSMGGPGADGIAGSPAPNSNPVSPYVPGTAPDGNMYGAGTAGEDSWAIFDVSVIRNATDDTVVWTRGDNDEYLTGYFHNEVDHYVKSATDPFSGAPIYEIRGVGGEIEMFLDTKDDFNGFQGGLGPFARNGFGTYGAGLTYGYPGAAADDGSEGSLFLSTTLAKGVAFGDLTSTFIDFFNGSALTGSGKAWLDVAGGTFASMFDTNGEFDPNGSAHDFFLSFTADPGSTGWTVINTGHALTTAVPEPTSMFLFGMGMLGLVATRIRRKKAA